MHSCTSSSCIKTTIISAKPVRASTTLLVPNMNPVSDIAILLCDARHECRRLALADVEERRMGRSRVALLMHVQRVRANRERQLAPTALLQQGLAQVRRQAQSIVFFVQRAPDVFVSRLIHVSRFR